MIIAAPLNPHNSADNFSEAAEFLVTHSSSETNRTERRSKAPAAAFFTCVGLLSCLLLWPKVLLINYTNSYLWGTYTGTDLIAILLQDMIVATLVFWIIVKSLSRPSFRRWLVASSIYGLLLIGMMIDTRIRELWLKPLNLDFILYFLSNIKDIASSPEIFFNRPAGFDYTFRRILLYIVIVWCFLSLGIGVVLLAFARQRSVIVVTGRRFALGVAGTILVLAIAATRVDRLPYQIEEHILTSAILDPLRSRGASATLEDLAPGFEQPLRPVTEVMASTHGGSVPAMFENLILIMWESVRWRDVGFELEHSPWAPYVQKLGREGILARCHVSLPHTSKAHYTVLTGRYPFPDLVIEESMSSHRTSIVRSLHEQNNIDTWCFTSQYLGFENMDGLFASCGIGVRLSVQGLEKRLGVKTRSQQFAFGSSDDFLYELVPSFLHEQSESYAAFFVPLAAHYKYEYAGKEDPLDISVNAYLHSILESDRFMEKLLGELRKEGLLRDTLVVIVGDHGESFGEHGTFLHNSSMFDEEIVVPLIFWSEDGRLKQDGIQRARQIDIAPTIADLFRLSEDGYQVQGQSLYLDQPIGPAFATTFFSGVAQALTEGSTKYIYYPSANRLTRFDLEADPNELDPLEIPDGEEKRRTVQRLRAFDAHSRRQFRKN